MSAVPRRHDGFEVRAWATMMRARPERITRLVREHADQLVTAMEEGRLLAGTDTLADAFNRNALVRALTR